MEMDLSIQQTELPKWHMAISDPPITDQMIADRESRAVVPDPAGRRSKQMSRRYLSASSSPNDFAKHQPPICKSSLR
jgi:hypothetical protein